ncbi:glycosyltransferase involved in cell wall biosynthesis [Dysgonomonas alginatilytica]|uniref:Glycosyltransferase involved in cell wall biosynthesis n=1 Tax=Dysgonomonas alginatilytica TaxID=1605892 RepID=A0A2V3PKA0_9BACT|nr:glycosyltransferase family 4 protein [Dysgonomonas alginatilytica]PXV61967.1 glycosyltransferase involved in cell wall biosynthesis [Dysgonomonas alginatilytica]
MKILQINKYPSLKGGTETVLFDTIRLLKAEGHDVILLSTDEGEVVYNPTYTISYPDRSASLVEKIYNLPSFFYNRSAVKILESIIEKEKPDIAHIHLYHNSFSNSILPVLKKYNIPIVMTLHEYRQICPSYLLLDKNQQICERCIDGNYLNCMFTRCAKGSFLESTLLTMEMYYRRLFYKTEKYVDRFICVSNFVYQKHQAFNRAMADKSTVIYNPVKLNLSNGIKKGGYLLYFGRLSPEKGLPTLLSAMKQLPDLKLKIAGAGDWLFSEIPSNVELLGFKGKEELDSIIYNAWYTIVPSLSYETFALSCAESMAQGTPVIASDMGAIPEIVQHEENGFLFEARNVENLKETISKAIMLSDEKYAEMVKIGYQSLIKFSEDKYLEQLLSVYNGLIHK